MSCKIFQRKRYHWHSKINLHNSRKEYIYYEELVQVQLDFE